MAPTVLDLLTPDAIDDPYPMLDELRERAPVHWSERHHAWVVLRYDDNVAGLSDPRMSSDRIAPVLAAVGERRDDPVGRVMAIMAHWMVVTDPPVHTRLRRLVSGAFRPRRVLAMEDTIRALVDELLDDLARDGGGELVDRFAYPLPATVIAALVGAPEADGDRFREWSQDLGVVAFGGDGSAGSDRHDRALRGLERMIAHFLELLERARSEPGADHLLANLAAGDEHGDRLSDEEIAGMCSLLLFAGHETTTNLIASALIALQRHPEQRARLLADPGAIGGAVEEALRYDGPVKVLVRWCTEDVELRGQTIGAQSKVYFVLAAANRDPEKFADPRRFDIGRTPNPHLGFGRSIHTCLGAQLARVETRVALGRLFTRFPDLAVDDASVRYHASREARAVQALTIDLNNDHERSGAGIA